MITNLRRSWLLSKFFLSAPLEMYREQYGEYAYWCYGVKGYSCARHCQGKKRHKDAWQGIKIEFNVQN